MEIDKRLEGHITGIISMAYPHTTHTSPEPYLKELTYTNSKILSPKLKNILHQNQDISFVNDLGPSSSSDENNSRLFGVVVQKRPFDFKKT
jgi:hypothetical protein